MERNLVRSVVVPASESLEGDEYLCVKPDGTLTGATGDPVYGIVCAGRPAGEASEVVVGGEYWVRVGADVNAGDVLTGGANGRAVPATVGTHWGYMLALEDASNGSLCKVKLLA